MKVLVISTSLRPRSNSHALAEAFARGAAEAGHEVETVSLRGKDLRFCTGCLACQKTQRCVQADDAPDLVRRMHDADAIAFATPIYYYEMSGQMKTIIDRANPLFASDYKFREVYLITASADTGEEAVKRVINGVQGWIDCFNGVKFSGYVCATVNDPSEINSQPQSLQSAYNLGKNI